MTDHPLLFREPARKVRNQAAYRQRNRDAINERKRAAYWANPEKARAQRAADLHKHYDARIAANRVWSAGYRTRLRSEMIAAYGGKCQCCGEEEPMFLQLDHIENDGNAERAGRSGHTMQIYARLKKAGWPKDRHQLLCANCNFGKALNGGVCPHHHHG